MRCRCWWLVFVHFFTKQKSQTKQTRKKCLNAFQFLSLHRHSHCFLKLCSAFLCAQLAQRERSRLFFYVLENGIAFICSALCCHCRCSCYFPWRCRRAFAIITFSIWYDFRTPGSRVAHKRIYISQRQINKWYFFLVMATYINFVFGARSSSQIEISDGFVALGTGNTIIQLKCQKFIRDNSLFFIFFCIYAEGVSKRKP